MKEVRDCKQITIFRLLSALEVMLKLWQSFTCKPSGFQMETTDCPHANHVVHTWKTHGVYMINTLCQHVYLIVST